MNEHWKDIIGHEGIYQVSNYGNVRSLDREIVRNDDVVIQHKGRTLKQRLNSSGYPQISLALGERGKRKVHLVHRLVALTFIENDENLATVNHIDGDKLNNRVDNLEWSSRSDNTVHAYENGLMDSQKAIVYTPNGESLAFSTLISCSRYFGYNWDWVQHSIKRKGNPFTHNGYTIKKL